MKRVNNKAFSIMELVLSLSLLSIALYFASDLIMGMSLRNKVLEEKNSLVNLKTLAELSLGNIETCTAHFKGMIFSPDQSKNTTAISVLYRDTAKTKKLLEVDQPPFIDQLKDRKVKEIQILPSKKWLTGTNANDAVVVYDTSQQIISGQNFINIIIKISLVKNNSTAATSIYDTFEIPISLSGHRAGAMLSDVIIDECSNSTYSVVKISKSSLHSVSASCSELNNAADYQSAAYASHESVCRCPCSTCATGFDEEGGGMVFDVTTMTWINTCKNATCVARIGLFCKVTRL